DPHAGAQVGPEERDQTGPEAPRSARARDVAEVEPEVAMDDRRQVRERSIEHLHIGPARSLLRAEHRRRASRAGEWSLDVARGHEPGASHVRIEPARVDAGKLNEGAAAAGADLPSLGVEEPNPEGLR